MLANQPSVRPVTSDGDDEGSEATRMKRAPFGGRCTKLVSAITASRPVGAACSVPTKYTNTGVTTSANFACLTDDSYTDNHEPKYYCESRYRDGIVVG